MFRALFPEKISTRIILLILFILVANALLTGLFSQQYHMQVGHAKTLETLHATLNYLSVHQSPLNIDKVLSSSQITHIETQPTNIIKAQNRILHRLSMKFNRTHKSIVIFYEDPSEPKILYIAYKLPNKPTYWLKMPQEPMENTGIIIAYLEEVMIIVIILFGSYMTARTINKPLRKIMKRLNQFGAGVIPPPLKEEGPTEIKQLAHSVNQMIQDHYELEKERELMLAGISHDLRTPLTRLQLLAEMSTASPETIQEIKEEIDQITKMQQQFIDYVSASNLEKEEWINVVEFCNEIVSKYKLTTKEIQLKNFSTQNIPLKTQPIGLYRILTNCLNNAMKYGAAPFTLEIFQDANTVTLNVLDSGEGVPDNAIADIFKPLYRGNTARKNADGSGLGLAIVSRIVKRLGGKIHAYNITPRGFCVNIVLPLS